MAGGTPLGVWHLLLLAAGAASSCVASSNTRFARLPSGVPSRRSCSAPVLFVEKQLLHHGNCHISLPLASCRLVIRFPCAAGRGCSEPSWAQCPALISGVLGLPWGPGCPGDTIHRPTARSCSLQASPDLSRCQWVMGGDVFRACIASAALLVNRGVGDSGCFASHLPFLQAAFHMPRSNVKSVAPAPWALSPGFSLPSSMFPALIQDWIKKKKSPPPFTCFL